MLDLETLPIRQKTDEEQAIKTKRIASLDFQRGLAIWMMVFLHVFNHMYDYSWVQPEDLFSNIDFFRSVFFAFSAFFGNWVGYFILISAIVNSFATTKKVLAGGSPEKLFGKQVLTGIGIWIAGAITESLGYYGYFGRVLRSGEVFTATPWVDPVNISFLWRRFFMLEALQIIAYAMIFTAIVQYFLIRKGGVEKFGRNIIIYGSLALIIVIASPFVWHGVDNMAFWKIPSESDYLDYGFSGEYHQSWPSEFFQSYNAGIVSFILAIFAGDLYPIFPYLSISFLGSLMGIAMAMPKPPKRLPLWGLCLTFGIGILAVISIFIPGLEFDITFERPTLGFFLILLTVQVGVVVFLFWLIDWRGKSEKFAQNVVVKYFRVWGMVALTIFALQIWSLVPRAIFNWTVPAHNLMNYRFGVGQEWIVLLFAIATILLYDLLIWSWAQINFIGSYEWLIVKFSSLATKKPSRRLNFRYMLNNVQWINYQLIFQEKEKVEEIN